MDSSETLSVIRLAVVVIVLGYASVLDWRTRRVPNRFWIVLAMIGMVLIPVQIVADDEALKYMLVLVPVLAVLSDVFWDSDEEDSPAYLPLVKYSAAVAAVAALGYVWGGSEYFQHLLAVPIMMMIFVVLYMLDVVRGGADAKALISLSIMFPFYPVLGSFPMLHGDAASAEILFPFAFVILVNAAILVVFVPLGFLVKNLAAKEFQFPMAFLGYKMDGKDIQGRHVWLMERIEEGRHVSSTRTRRKEDLAKELALLKEAGYDRVWVTPKIPFIVPITASVVFSTVIGNLLLLLFPF